MKKITLFFVMIFISFASYAQLPETFEGTTIPNVTGDWVLNSGTWKVFDNGIGTAQSWGVIPAPNSCNGRSAYLNRENVPDGTFAEDWLVTHQVTVPTNGQLRFSTKQTLAPNFGSIYTIRVSTTSQTNAATFTTIQTWTETDLNAVYNVCEEKVVDFPAAYHNQPVYVAFVMTNDEGDRWIIDDVNIVEKCLDPTNQTATNPTLTSSTLGWNNPSGATQWEVEIVPTGGTTTGTGVIVTTNPYTVTGLTEGTCYDFYVRALCGSGTTASSSLWIGPYNFCTSSLGESCGAPISIPSIPYTTTDNTSGYGDDYSGSPGSSGCGTTGTYLNGDDVFYSFVSTTGIPVTITSQTDSTWSGLFVYSSCANVGVSCVVGNTAGNGTTTPDSVTFTPTIGQTYYIVISTWATPQSVPYTLTIVENSCTNMTSNFAVVSNCTSVTDPNTFFVNATVTNMGSATSIAGTSTPASPTAVPAITAPGVMQFGPFPNGTIVTVNLQNEQDVNCFKNSPSLTQTLCPATNNLCSGAIPVTCGSTETQTTVGATTAGAPTGTCGTTGGSGGLWYSYMGNGDIVTFSLCGSAFDTKIQVVTGSCGAFTCVTGNDDFCGTQSQVQVTTVVGTLYYIYVYGFGTAQGVFTLNTTCITPPPPPTNDNCATATTVLVNTDGTCTQVTPGTVVGGTPSSQTNACVGSADDDVWFQFTATQTSHTITIQNIIGSTLDLNHAVYTSTNTTDPCGNLTQTLCSDPNLSIATTFVAGQIYYIRVYTATAVPLQTTTFDVCVSVPPPPPSNDSCATPTIAPVNASLICTNTVPGTISSATASPEPNACTGTADDDVWFQFTALASIHNVNLNNVQGTTTDLAFAVYSGVSCGALTQINCQVNNSGLVGGLTAGEVYYIRVYSQPATPNLLANFDLCITTPTQCDSAQTTCGDGSIIQNQIGLPSYGNIGCLFTTPNPFWFTIEIETSGPITFTLNQTSAGNSDVDFILWGPFTTAQINSNACNNLYDYPDGNTTIPNNVVDCSYSASATEFIDIPNAIVGQHYLLLVTNYGNSLGTFNLNQTSGSGSAACCSVNLGQDVTLCNQPSHTITATVNSQDTIKWFKDNVLIPGQTTTTLTVTETGTYKCEITCGQLTKEDEVVITFNESVADILANEISCTNFVLPSLSANNNYYTDTNAGGTMLNAGDVISTTQTIYIYSESGTTPNCTDESSFTVTITSTPDVISTPPMETICSGTATNLSLTSSLPGTTFSWTIVETGVSGAVAGMGDSITDVLTTTGSTNGTVVYTITPTNNSCVGTPIDVTVTVLALPTTPTITSNSPICSGSDAQFTLTGIPNAVVSYDLNGGSVQTITLDSTGSGLITQAATTTDAVLTLNGIINGTCSAVITTMSTVAVNSIPFITSITSNNQICLNNDAIFNIQGSPNAVVTYTINGGSSQTVTLDSSGNSVITISNVTISQTINLSSISLNGCTDGTIANSTLVTVIPTPVADTVVGTSVCSATVYTFPIVAAGNSFYTGTGGTGTMYNSGDTVTINATQTFYVYAQSGTTPNCTSETSFTITAIDSPVVSLSGGCVNNVYTINASLSSGSSATYVWTGPSGTINDTDSSITVNQDGEYTCIATTTLPNGSLCSSQAVVFAANGTLCTIQKGISPNNDGLNDNFDLTGLNVKKLEIFNRYGTKVYSFSNYTDQWYGQSDNGNELPSGTYYFVIDRDNVAAKSGWIYINR